MKTVTNIFRLFFFLMTDAGNGNNSKQDTTDSDATPTNNVLFIGEATNDGQTRTRDLSSITDSG